MMLYILQCTCCILCNFHVVYFLSGSARESRVSFVTVVQLLATLTNFNNEPGTPQRRADQKCHSRTWRRGVEVGLTPELYN